MVAASTSFSEPSRIFTLRNIALGVGGIVLFSGALAGGGRLLQLGGAHLMSTPAWSHVGRAATIAGDKLFFVGKGAFLSVAVPIYTISWVAPKWILTVGIPKGAALSHKYILIPAYHGMVKICTLSRDALIKTAQAIYTYVFRPCYHLVSHAAKWAWDAVIVPGFKEIAKAAEACFRALRHFAVLTANAAKWAWSSVLLPVITEVAKATHEIYQSILVPASLWVWKTALLPAGKCIALGAALLKNSVEKTASIAYHSLMLPAYSAITESAAQTAAAVRDATSWILYRAHSS